MSIFTKKNRASVCKTLHVYPQHLLAPKYGNFTQCLISTQKIGLCRKVKQVIY